MNQRAKIIKALGTWISPLDALKMAGTFKLATRVGELRRDGYKIDSKWHSTGRFKVYRIVK
jgi:Helix-turn-helix domain